LSEIFERYNAGKSGGWRLLQAWNLDVYNIVVERLKERRNPDRSRRRMDGSYTYGMKVHGPDSSGSKWEKNDGLF
jgi:hypothetical protein